MSKLNIQSAYLSQSISARWQVLVFIMCLLFGPASEIQGRCVFLWFILSMNDIPV